MLVCMRTTLNIDDNLMRRVRARAAVTGRTLTEVVEQALRQAVAGDPPERSDYRLRLVTVRGRLRRGVDLADRDALYDRMEGRR